MPSPFPGMDPYLESLEFWAGFHYTYVIYIRSALTKSLPAGYYAEVEQHVWLEGEDPEDRVAFAIPDSFILDRGGGAAATVVASEPATEVTLPKPAKRKGPKYVTIVDKSRNRIVTVIEVLSPSNKEPGDDRESYLHKLNDYLLAGVNLVEIDLLREGDRLQFGKPKPPPADYYALISRADRFPRASVWAFTVRDSLPILPIPLKPVDGEVLLDLRACLDRAYEDAGYANRVNYTSPPEVPLRKLDAEWAAELLAKRGGQ